MKDLGDLMKQAQSMQADMTTRMDKMRKAQSELRVQGESGAGVVKVTMSGNYEVTAIKIDPSLANEELDMLEDLLAAAVNDTVYKVEEQAQKLQKEHMGGLMPNMKLPEGFKFPFG